MNFLSNAHTHSTWCDGKNTIPEMIAAAEKLGFVSLGFSGHGCRDLPDDWSMSRENQTAYFKELNALGELPFKLWKGLELDAMSTEEVLKENIELADYVIGSTHFISLEGEGVTVDGEPDLLLKYVNDHHRGSGLSMAEEYFSILSRFVNQWHPDIMGHFDLVRKYAARLKLFDEASADYRKMALKYLEKCAPSGCIMEINTGGMSRGYLDNPYPTQEVLNAWHEMGGKITITSDCHDARFLDNSFPMAYDMIRKAGYTSVFRLGTGENLWDEISVD